METFERLESEVRAYVRSFPTVFARAKGERLYDEEGRSWIDFLAGAGALNYGHNHPRLQEALVSYVQADGITHGLDMATRAKRRFMLTLEEIVLKPRGLEYKFLFPGPTGTNAVEAALKVARKATGRRKVYGFEGGFHGMTLGSLAVTANRMKRAGAGTPLPHARLLPFDGPSDGPSDVPSDEPGAESEESLRVLQDALTTDAREGALPAAIILETVQCEGGVRVASRTWLREVARLARLHGVLLIVDDIQAGCGRSGSFFSFEEAGLRPDIVCLSKSLSGMGLPLALVLLRPELDVLAPGEHNGTFRGHNLAFVTATEALLTFWGDDAFAQEVRAKERTVRERLERIVAGLPAGSAAVRGRGLVQGIAFEDTELASATARHAFERGLVIETAGPDDEVLKLLPPLVISDEALAEGLDTIEQSLEAALADVGAAQNA